MNVYAGNTCIRKVGNDIHLDLGYFLSGGGGAEGALPPLNF